MSRITLMTDFIISTYIHVWRYTVFVPTIKITTSELSITSQLQDHPSVIRARSNDMGFTMNRIIVFDPMEMITFPKVKVSRAVHNNAYTLAGD